MEPHILRLSIYVPTSACACMYSHFIERVQNMILPHKDRIQFTVKNAESPEAEELNISENAVVIENYPGSEKPIVITRLARFEHTIQEYLKIRNTL
jgi:hypothetical protein